MPDRTDPAEVTTEIQLPDVAAFERLGVRPNTAYQYVRVLDRAAHVLAPLGQSLLTCDERGIAALGDAIPVGRRALLRSALNRTWGLARRLDAPSTSGLKVPSRPAAERAALKDFSVPANEVRALLNRLRVAGYTRTYVAKRLGVSVESLRVRGEKVDLELADQLGDLADELLTSGRAGPGSLRWGPMVDDDPRFDRASLMGTGVSRKTAGTYTRVLARISAMLKAEGKDIASCTGRDIARVAETFPNTQSSRAQIRGALTRAWEIIERPDPPSLRAVRVPPKPKARSRALSHDTAIALERAAWDRNDNKGLATLVGLYSGLRRAEIARLRWEDIKVEPDGEQWMTVIGKGSVKADIPVHPHLVEALTRARRLSGWLFPGRYGGPVSPDTIWRWTKEVACDAGIENLRRFSTHVLRHTALTEANDASNNLRGVQEFARHSRPEITAIYTRLTAKQLVDVVNTIDYGRGPAAGAPGSDPADLIPGVSYRQLVQFFESERRQEAWITLGLVAAAAGWRLELLPDVPGFHWAHPAEPRIWASPGGPYPGFTESPGFDLVRQAPDDKDWAEMWTLEKPEHLLVLAELLISGAPAPEPTIYLGRPDDWPDDEEEDEPFVPVGPAREVAMSAT